MDSLRPDFGFSKSILDINPSIVGTWLLAASDRVHLALALADFGSKRELGMSDSGVQLLLSGFCLYLHVFRISFQGRRLPGQVAR